MPDRRTAFAEGGKGNNMLLIKNGYIKTMAGDDIEKGYLLIGDDGKIAKVGSGEPNIEADEIIDAEGRIVTPGIVEAHCHIGYGNGTGSGFNEYSDPFTPHMSVIDAIDPYSDDLATAARAGVTTVCTGPGSTNLIGGTFAAIKTVGKRVTDMIVKYPLAMKCAVGENPCNDFGVKQNRAPRTRMAVAAMLREFLHKCKVYCEAKDNGESPAYDVKMEAMLPVMRGELPLKIHVHASHDIYTVLRITKEFGLKFTIDHCTDGERVAEDLAELGCPCFVGPSYGYKTKREVDNRSFGTAGVLRAAGIPISIITDAGVTPIQYLPMFAGFCVSEGLPMEEGWRAITKYPAEQTGIGDRVGTLEVGKDGDAVIWTENPLRYIGAHAKTTVILGKVVHNEG